LFRTVSRLALRGGEARGCHVVSIAVGVTLPDGFLLIADGRDCLLFGDGPPIEDGIDKLQPIGDRVYAVPFGVSRVSADAITILRTVWDDSQDPLSIRGMVDGATATAWDRFRATVDPTIDWTDERLGVALLVAGMAGPAHEPFICESLHSEHVVIPAGVGRGPWVVAVRGGEEQGALERFNEAAAAIIRAVCWDADGGPHNSLTRALTEAAVDTIEAAAREAPTIGWPIRSLIVREGFPATKEVARRGETA